MASSRPSQLQFLKLSLMDDLKIKCCETTDNRVMWHCPGCQMAHSIKVPHWDWNKSLTFPTFSPSVLVRYSKPLTGDEIDLIMSGSPIDRPDEICHCFVRNGKIEFLHDCTHHLNG